MAVISQNEHLVTASYICSSCVAHLSRLMLAGSRPAGLFPSCLHLMFNMKWSFQGCEIWHAAVNCTYFIHFLYVNYPSRLHRCLFRDIFLHESSNCIRYPPTPFFFLFSTCLLIPHPAREILFAVFEMQGIKLSQNINDKTAKFVAPFCTHRDASALQAFGKDAPEDRDTDWGCWQLPLSQLRY